jgi:hypothetical protein
MKSRTILFSVIIVFVLHSCKKKEKITVKEDDTSPKETALTFVTSIGTAGTGFGQFYFLGTGGNNSQGIATDGNYVYVADKGNNCIKKVELSGNSIIGWYGFNNGAWGYYDASKTPDINFEAMRLLYKNNFLYASVNRNVSDPWEDRFFKINLLDNTLSDSSNVSSCFWIFSFDIDSNENIFIYFNDSIKKYNHGFLMGFGGYGSTDGKLDNSYGNNNLVIINDTIVVSDPGNKRFQKFKPDGTYISSTPLDVDGLNQYFYSSNSKYCYFYSNASGGGYKEYNYVNNTNSIWKVPSDYQSYVNAWDPFVILNDKIIFQDSNHNRLLVFTK